VSLSGAICGHLGVGERKARTGRSYRDAANQIHGVGGSGIKSRRRERGGGAYAASEGRGSG
jgi:hypothetical protein